MSPDHRAPPPAARPGWLPAAAVFLAVLGARLWLVASAGSAVPFWDQWDAEALGLYRPWLTGSLDPGSLFAPHNEHRIALTRLADLALFAAAGIWNPWWQLVLNAVLQAATAALLLVVLPQSGCAGLRPRMLAGLVLLFAVPAGWQNALWGFQSQVLFSTLLAVGALAGLVAADLGSARWWAGWLCALLALGATAAGPLAALAALPFALLSVIESRNRWWTLAALGALLAAGLAWQVSVPGHAALRATGVTQFVSVFLHALAWPWVDTPWLAPLVQAPGLWLLVRLIRLRRAPDAGERVLLALLLWTWLQAAAIAWSRGAGLPDGRPLSRYQDPLVIGAVVQFVILLRLVGNAPVARVAGLAWGGCVLAGLLLLTTHVLSVNLPYKRQQDRESLARIRAYLASGDPAALAVAPGGLPGPHPDLTVVRRVLDDPVLQPALPAEFTAADPTPPAYVRHGKWLLAAAIATLALAWRRRAVAKD